MVAEASSGNVVSHNFVNTKSAYCNVIHVVGSFRLSMDYKARSLHNHDLVTRCETKTFESLNDQHEVFLLRRLDMHMIFVKVMVLGLVDF